jgi:hypothetical protein
MKLLKAFKEFRARRNQLVAIGVTATGTTSGTTEIRETHEEQT